MHTPMTTKQLHHHTTGFGMAFNLPINDAIQRMFQSARELDESANKMAKEHEGHARNNFGQRIADAVKRKSPRHDAAAVFAAAPSKDDDDDDDDEEKEKDADFGKRIKKAIKRRSRS